MKFTPHDETEAKKLSERPAPLKEGRYQGLITEAIDKKTRDTNKDMIEFTIMVEGRTLKDWIVGENNRDALRLRHLCESCGGEVFQHYQSGTELSQSDFPGHRVTVVLSIKRGSKGFPSRNVIDDYAPPDASVVQLRSA